METTWLERYRPLVGDFDAFAEACRSPLPRAAWVRPGRLDRAGLERRLRAAGLRCRPVLWLSDALLVEDGGAPGRLLEYRAGACHLQEEASLLPPLLLGARPGERVLDTCAAPGGKTVRIALAMAGRGTVVAVDRDPRRLRAVRSVVDRLGAPNVVGVVRSASNLPRAFGGFDRVLCDAPCSGEGTVRKHPHLLERPRADSSRLVRLQETLLHRAVLAARPGGRIVYSTCTFAPEENEGVVDTVLTRCAGWLEVGEGRPRGLATSPGVCAFGGRRFSRSLERAHRLWPHVHGTGGFFVCVLEKSARAPVPPCGTRAELPPVLDAAPWRAALRRRFGVEADPFEGFVLLAAGRRSVVRVPLELEAPPLDGPHFLGLPAFHATHPGAQPTTAMARDLGPLAARNVVRLGAADALRYASRRDAVLPATARLDRGLVLVGEEAFFLGCGRWRPEEGGGRLESLFPKEWAGESGGGARPVREGRGASSGSRSGGAPPG